LLEDGNVRAVISTAYLRDNIGDSTDALEIVAIVLIVLACMLAFVVLFNLTSINITERVRELATIKVLGFYNEELSMYIYRENAVVTLIGIILGLIGGIFLHDHVLTGAEIDLLMFPHIIKPMSYVYSAALTVAFAVFVNLVMNIKLARIDMVESLKNVE
jgi:putative ABC transport system permease protein